MTHRDPESAHPLTTLPENEPHAMPLATRRSDLVQQIEELEGMLHYMGSLHPQRDSLRDRLRGLRSLLQRWDRSQHSASDAG